MTPKAIKCRGQHASTNRRTLDQHSRWAIDLSREHGRKYKIPRIKSPSALVDIARMANTTTGVMSCCNARRMPRSPGDANFTQSAVIAIHTGRMILRRNGWKRYGVRVFLPAHVTSPSSRFGIRSKRSTGAPTQKIMSSACRGRRSNQSAGVAEWKCS
eukprot:scaffold62466_cov65-Phaeocystis_antarctica.AAC.3